MKYTRKEYLNKNCTHAEYYSQFVTDSIKSIVKEHFTIEKLKKAYNEDKYFNTIPLIKWDRLTIYFKDSISKSLKDAGDFYSLAGGVCILKCAAEILVLES